MAKSQHTWSKRQREKEKQKKNKEKRERMEERKHRRSEGDTGGMDIDWSAAPVNNTLSAEEQRERDRVAAQNGANADKDSAE